MCGEQWTTESEPLSRDCSSGRGKVQGRHVTLQPTSPGTAGNMQLSEPMGLWRHWLLAKGQGALRQEAGNILTGITPLSL